MSFSESLTVRILGDSSELQRELDSVLNRFDELKSQISETSNSARQFSSSFNRLSQALGPLQQVSQLIARIGQQLQSISQRPVSLNVAPALQSLQQLSRAAQGAAAAIQAIPPIPALGGGSPTPLGVAGPTQAPVRLASGGLVSGPSGIDRIPAQLSAGEYVLNRDSVATLGLSFLERMNSSPRRVLDLSTTPQSKPTSRSVPKFNAFTGAQKSARRLDSARTISQSSQTNNHFGGITIQVTSPADSEELVRNFQLQGIGRRIRQG